jgi:hypothetical protein
MFSLLLTRSWNEQEERWSRETDALVGDLDARYAAASGGLDAEWQTEQRRQRYTKPSNRLLNLKVMLKGMLKARRFRDVDALGRIIDLEEQRENAEAAVKMQHDFGVADARLGDLSEMELVGIDGKADSLMSGLVRAKERDLRPYYQRLDNLRRVREVELTNQKKIACLNARFATPAKLGDTCVPRFVLSPWLNVPAFTPKRRPGSSKLPSQRRLICRPKTAVSPRPAGAK